MPPTEERATASGAPAPAPDPLSDLRDEPPFGLLTQWGLRRSVTALRKPGAVDELAEHGVPQVWRHPLRTLLAVIDDLDRSSPRLTANASPRPR